MMTISKDNQKTCADKIKMLQEKETCFKHDFQKFVESSKSSIYNSKICI